MSYPFRPPFQPSHPHHITSQPATSPFHQAFCPISFLFASIQLESCLTPTTRTRARSSPSPSSELLITTVSFTLCSPAPQHVLPTRPIVAHWLPLSALTNSIRPCVLAGPTLLPVSVCAVHKHAQSLVRCSCNVAQTNTDRRFTFACIAPCAQPTIPTMILLSTRVSRREPSAASPALLSSTPLSSRSLSVRSGSFLALACHNPRADLFVTFSTLTMFSLRPR